MRICCAASAAICESAKSSICRIGPSHSIFHASFLSEGEQGDRRRGLGSVTPRARRASGLNFGIPLPITLGRIGNLPKHRARKSRLERKISRYLARNGSGGEALGPY